MTNSNQPADRVFLTSEVERLSAELGLAHADVALLRRLKDAEKNATRIAGDLTVAQDTLAKAIADDLMAERAAAFANFKSISISVAGQAGEALTALSAKYTITVCRLTHDSKTSTNHWQDHSYTGFNALPSDAYGYLMQCRPDAIPAIIMALAPGDAGAAMETYFRALQRGHMTTAVAA